MGPGDLSLVQWLGAATAALIVGLSKAGFGSGAGLLAVPLMAVVLGPRTMLPVMLLVLITGDVFSLIHYPRTHHRRNLAMLVPGLLLGIGLGALVLGWFLALRDGELWMKRAIGGLCILFVVVQFWRMMAERRGGGAATTYVPRIWHGVGIGAAAGLSSTLAHAGGPLVTLFLLPQKLERRVFVGTVIRYFFVGNVVKLIPYTAQGLMSRSHTALAALMLPWVVVGTLAGVRLNRRFSDRAFRLVVYCLAFGMGLMLLAAGRNGEPAEAAARGPAGECFQQGLDAYAAGDFDAAAAAFERAGAAGGRWQMRAGFNAGLALWQAGRHAEAERAFRAVAGAGEEIVRLRAAFNLGNCALRFRRPADAVRRYEEAVAGCDAALASGAVEGEAAVQLDELRERARANLRAARVRLARAVEDEEPAADGAPPAGGPASGEGDGAGRAGPPDAAERAPAPAGATGYAGGSAPGTRSVGEILEGVGRRDTGPVLRPLRAQPARDGKDW